MSCSPGPEPRRPVLLGIRDAAIEGGSRCSWDTSKVGATPDCVPGISMQYPQCTHCSNPLIHVVQVYCPLEGSPYHRTINVLACQRPECWGRSDSWKVLRSQYQETPQKLETKAEVGVLSQIFSLFLPPSLIFTVSSGSENLVSVTAKDWCSEADDWGVDDSPELGTEELLSLGAAQALPSLSDREIGVQTTRLEGLSLLENAEGKGLVTRAPVPVFQPFYISVMEEEDYTLETGFSHEQELLQEYQRREGINVEQLAFSSCEDDGVTEAYEKGKVRHGDRTFVKFMKRISSCAEQILRYCWNGSPLLLASPPVEMKTATPACGVCGSARVFEFQLMPALVNMLKSASSEEVGVEFGTVLIYTCEKSCWAPSNQTPLEECAVVQGDPDQCFFR